MRQTLVPTLCPQRVLHNSNNSHYRPLFPWWTMRLFLYYSLLAFYQYLIGLSVSQCSLQYKCLAVCCKTVFFPLSLFKKNHFSSCFFSMSVLVYMSIIKNVKRKKKEKKKATRSVIWQHCQSSFLTWLEFHPINRKARRLEKNLFEEINLYINVQNIYNI